MARGGAGVSATLAEVGHNHFFRGSIDGKAGDFIYFQGHASPGMYSRAYVEGRLSDEHLQNFRHELRDFVLEVSKDRMVFVDEAYFEYVENPAYGSMIDLVAEGHKNIIVSRTASKIHGLAGLRVVDIVLAVVSVTDPVAE